jgi:hypothetical protein
MPWSTYATAQLKNARATSERTKAATTRRHLQAYLQRFFPAAPNRS